MATKPIGKIIHYYDKLGVAIVHLDGKLKVGERIRIERGDDSFDQEVASMQVEHEEVVKAKKKDEVGIKVDGPTKEGALVYRIK